MSAATKMKLSLASAFVLAVLFGGWKLYIAHVQRDAVKEAQWHQRDLSRAAEQQRHDSIAHDSLIASRRIIAAWQDSSRAERQRTAFLDSVIVQLNETPFPEVHLLGDTVQITGDDEDPTKRYILPHKFTLLLAAQDTAIAKRDTVLHMARNLMLRQAKHIEALQSAYNLLTVTSSQQDTALTIAAARIVDLQKRIKPPSALRRVGTWVVRGAVGFALFRLGQASVR